MTWIMLMPRETEAITAATLSDHDDRPNTVLLRTLREKLKDGEIELTHKELREVEAARRNWRGGHERAFDAVLAAAKRHA
jgi:hypothetical protein